MAQRGCSALLGRVARHGSIMSGARNLQVSSLWQLAQGAHGDCGLHAKVALALGARGFRSSVAMYMPERLTIVVPSMGDSIVEGTICDVLKAAGESVQEDEVIAQIETDKVTVDIRAPKAGTISTMFVKTDENVNIGQTVAYLEPGDSSASAPQGEPQAAAPAAASSKDGHPAQQPEETSHRTPSISFPPRMTASGERISAMPAEQQHAYQAQLSSERTGASTAGAAGQPPAAAQQPQAGSRPASTVLTEQPARYPYSDKEMECIMLGGAGMVDTNVEVTYKIVL